MVCLYHDDVIKWKHFPRYWPFVRGIHRSPVNSLHNGQWRGALMFSLICVWINGWENNREAGDLRRYRAHYDVIVMPSVYSSQVCSESNSLETGRLGARRDAGVSGHIYGDVMIWWRHQMETFAALLAVCVGNSSVTGKFPAKRPVMWSFDVFFDLRLYKRLSKQFWGWWFETPLRPLWRHGNDTEMLFCTIEHLVRGIHLSHVGGIPAQRTQWCGFQLKRFFNK